MLTRDSTSFLRKDKTKKRWDEIKNKRHTALFWSRIRESNPPSQLGKLLYYRCTNPAYRCIIAEPPEKSNLFLSEKGIPVEEIRRVCYI